MMIKLFAAAAVAGIAGYFVLEWVEPPASFRSHDESEAHCLTLDHVQQENCQQNPDRAQTEEVEEYLGSQAVAFIALLLLLGLPILAIATAVNLFRSMK
jgi:hypothetical protein